MKERISALIILLANIVILAHAAIPHYHGDDMIATILHIANEEDSHEDHCCHKDGDASHDDGHCLINDTLMASICRESDTEIDFETLCSDSQSNLLGILPCLFTIPTPTVKIISTPGEWEEIFYIPKPLLRSNGLRAPPTIG